jgi:hypothetical protein
VTVGTIVGITFDWLGFAHPRSLTGAR